MSYFQPDTETLLAVVLGAALATAGGFGERQLERAIQKREKEKSAAMLFGELLNAMRLILRLGSDARGRGDPFGPVTLRFMRAAQREIEIYDRNRETLFDLADPSIRARISVLIARLSFALDGVIDSTGEIASAEANLRTMGLADTARAETESNIAALKETRKIAFDFALQGAQQIPPLLTALAPLAKHNFTDAETEVAAI